MTSCDVTSFRLRARHRRRQHRAGVVIPARLRLKWTLPALAIGQFKKKTKKTKWEVVGGSFFCGAAGRHWGPRTLLLCRVVRGPFVSFSCGILRGHLFRTLVK